MSPQLTTSPLGKTGLQIPPVVYGTSFLGNLYRDIPRETKLAIMSEWFAASDLPVAADSAGKYGAGLALETIGKGLRELGIPPEKITISNKLGWYRVPLTTPEPTFEKGVWANLKNDAVQRISYDGIIECWEQGNELLGDYNADLVSVHDPDEYLAAASDQSDRHRRYDDILASYQALFELKEKGLVKAIGIGSKDWEVIRELYRDVKFDWVMFANSFTVYRHPDDILEFIRQLDSEGTGIINSAIFNAGFITGGQYFDYRILDPDNPDDKPIFAWRDKFFEICRKFDVQPGDACLHFAISPPQICAVALNPSKPERIRRNLDVLSSELPAAFWQAMKTAGLIKPDYPYL